MESTGAVEKAEMKLGGAAAGFFIIFLAFSRLYSTEINKIREIEAKAESKLWVTLEFDDPSITFFEKKKRKYEIRKNNGEIISDKLTLDFLPPGGWIWRLPVEIRPDDSISLEIVDDNNQDWIAKNVIPNITIKPSLRKGDYQ